MENPRVAAWCRGTKSKTRSSKQLRFSFQDLGNSPAAFEASRWADFLGCPEGWGVQTACRTNLYPVSRLKRALSRTIEGDGSDSEIGGADGERKAGGALRLYTWQQVMNRSHETLRDAD